jgi:ATP-dependent DNA helicase RecQ
MPQKRTKKLRALNTRPSTPTRASRKGTALMRTLREVFGLDALRPGQETVMSSVMQGHHTLAVMPTGAGKSLCYQLPALLLPGTTIVVSPLISLMKDQRDKLTALGVGAVQVNSAVPASEAERAAIDVDDGRAEFVFTTPEQLTKAEFLHTLAAGPIDLFVIDEAHCISHWGHDFRPAYRALGDAIRALGSPTVLALTATAPQAVVDDISEQLALDELRVVNLGLFRQNLQLTVEPTTSDAEKTQMVLDLLFTRPGPTIIYAATVRHVNALADALTRAGHDVRRYHGALGPRRRSEAQDRFMSGETAIMVATNAFGMGIDKPDIRLVVHYDLPGSLDAYYQEAGRAGRDGAPARAVLLYQHADRRLQKFFVAGRFPTTEQFVAVADALKTATRADLDLTIEDLMASTRLSANKVQVIVDVMKAARAVRATRGVGFRLRRDLARAVVVSMAETFDTKARHDSDKLQRMVSYAQTALCRWKLVLESLDEPPSWAACGLCDNCRGTAALASGIAEGA